MRAVPRKVLHEPEHIQRMYIREFERVEGQTGSILAGKKAANRLLYLHKRSREDNPKEEHVLVTMTAHITEMSAAQVLPAGILAKIKQKDPHPFFALYTIGCSGDSNGHAIKDGKTVTTRKGWSFSAIKELASKIKSSAARVIVGHDSQKSVGRVVYAFTKVIDKTLHALAVVHIINADVISKIKTKEFDVCSIEGNVTLMRNSRHDTWYVKAVEYIDRLAIGNSILNKPGFDRASLKAAMQELEKNN